MSFFFRAKLSCIFLTFILTNSIKAVKLRECVRSASYLTTQPRPFSPLQRSDLGIFQPRTRYSSIFFPIEPPYPLPFHWVGNALGIFQPAPYLASFDWVGIPQYLSTEPHSVSRPRVGVPCIFHLDTTQYLSNWEGADNLLHHQIKLTISDVMGDARARRDSPQFPCIPHGVR